MTDEIEPMAVGPGPDGAGPAPSAEPPSDGADLELLALIDRLATLLDRSDLTELEVESGGTGLVLRKPSALAPITVASVGRLVTGRRDERGAGHAERARRGAAAQAQAVGQGAADRHLLRLPGARLGTVRDGRRRGRGRPDHRPDRGDEAVQRDQERPRPDASSGSWPRAATLVKAKQPLIEVEPL